MNRIFNRTDALYSSTSQHTSVHIIYTLLLKSPLITNDMTKNSFQLYIHVDKT